MYLLKGIQTKKYICSGLDKFLVEKISKILHLNMFLVDDIEFDHDSKGVNESLVTRGKWTHMMREENGQPWKLRT